MKKIELCEEEEKELIDLCIGRLERVEALLEELEVKDAHVRHELSAAAAHLTKMKGSKGNKKG